MNRKGFKAIVGILLMVFFFFVAFGFLTYNRVENHDADAFSVGNVVEDIRVISEKPHSILDPDERKEVRDYLFHRLEEMGGEPVCMPEDSVRSRFGGFFDISNVFCSFNPSAQDTSSSYILLVAHFDSRFPEQVLGRTVASFGAADDGYGVAVALELLRNAVTYRDRWSQGIKVLFTDSEEHRMDGMRSALERYNSLFDNVALILNIEARGVKGPALMFETSRPNEKLIDFYLDRARYPFIYSLMGTVYDLMPNFSDFTLGKTMFPGYNIAVIDNVNYYHTDKDCFENINTKSLGHYGAQLEPMVKSFLTEDSYGDPDCFRPVEGDENPILFTVPGLGTVRLSRGANSIFNAVVLFLFCLVLCCYVLMRRVELANVFRQMLKILVFGLCFLLAGEGIAFLAAEIAGTPFRFISTRGVPGDAVLCAVAVALMVFVYLAAFLRARRRSKTFVFEHILGALLLILVISAVLLAVVGDNFFLTGPAACALLALLLHIFVYLNIFSLPALLAIELLAVSFLYNVFTALTIGSLGVVMLLAFIYVILIVSLFESYLTQKR